MDKNVKNVTKKIQKICRDDLEAMDLLDQVTVGKPGRRWEAETDNLILDNVQNNKQDDKETYPAGNSAQRSLHRLRKSAPEIHARVLAGELSPHAGMIDNRPYNALICPQEGLGAFYLQIR